MKIAVEGCCHGELDKIYDTIRFIEKENSITIDLLLICGDFQAVRNRGDLECMAVPDKFKLMNTFYKYYSGEKTAPVLTIFIGGNHEASNYLQELPYGGWVAPNIYYIGYAGIINYRGVRIGGLSGIYKEQDYLKGHYEHPPYNGSSVRSAYHVRNLEVFRLKQVRQHLHVFMSHDWPRGVYHYGDVERLLQRKSYFRDEVERCELGSRPAEELLHYLQPDYWFSAHLHVKFAAIVQHHSTEGSERPGKMTKFLALDKCLPRRQFLQVLDIAHDEQAPKDLHLDAEWLCILKSTNHLLSTSPRVVYMPGPGSGIRHDFSVTAEDMTSLNADFDNNLAYPKLFERTVPAYSSTGNVASIKARPVCQINPQTDLLCKMLGITNPNAIFCKDTSSAADEAASGSHDNSPCLNRSTNPEEIALDDDDDDGGSSSSCSDDADASVADSSDVSYSSFIDSYARPDDDTAASAGDTSLQLATSLPPDAEPLRCAAHDADAKRGDAAAAETPAAVTGRRPLLLPAAKESSSASVGDVTPPCKRSSGCASPPAFDDLAAHPGSRSAAAAAEAPASATALSLIAADEAKAASGGSSTPAPKRFRGRNVAIYSILQMQGQQQDESERSAADDDDTGGAS